MIINNFRTKLRQEAKLWWDEGLIAESQYKKLAERYEFHQSETKAGESSNPIFMVLGGILLSLGILTFVAANWQLWSPEVKLILLIGLFVAVNVTGFHYWRPGTGKKQHHWDLGKGLLLLGALLLGANLVLVMQIFNIRGSDYQIFFYWSGGVLLMAYSLRLTSLGILALFVSQIGYGLGLEELWSISQGSDWGQLVVQHMPLLVLMLFVPLSYLCRSRWIFIYSAIAFIISLQLNLRPLELLTYINTAPWVISFALALPPALLWSYDDLLYPTVNFRYYQRLSRAIALCFFGILFYILSFRYYWQQPLINIPSSSNLVLRMLPLIDLGILSGLAVLQWLYLIRRTQNGDRYKIDPISIMVICFIVITAIVPIWHHISQGDTIAIFTFNVLLAILSFGLIRQGLQRYDKGTFWAGITLIVAQIITRMLEYDPDLLLKSLVFLLCGIGIIFAGQWFERHTSNH